MTQTVTKNGCCTDDSKKEQKHISLASTDETVNNMYPAEEERHMHEMELNEAESNMNDVANFS